MTASVFATDVLEIPRQKSHWVKVENIAGHVDSKDVILLFRTSIGEIKDYHDYRNYAGGHIEIGFSNLAAASQALCLSGYMLGGAPLFVSPTPMSSDDAGNHQKDDRRNLYVLGLPFALTKSEFSAVFSPYGTVSHCVILATLDNSSRRRGFVVMSTHEEAKRAMTCLSRTQVKGHILDISWAVVQRSQGFLDGGDRAIVLDARPPQNPCDLEGIEKSSGTSVPSNIDLASLSMTLVPTNTICVTHLSTILFPHSRDLDPLICPFGRVNRLQVLKNPAGTTFSIIVEYASAEMAQEAKEFLSGQCYIGHRIETAYVRPKTSLSSFAAISTLGCYNDFYGTNACSFLSVASPLSYGNGNNYGPLLNVEKTLSMVSNGHSTCSSALPSPADFHRRVFPKISL